MQISQEAFKVGLIGCGRISQSYAEAIQQCPHVSLEAVVDIRKDAADALAERSQARAYYDIESYLEKEKTQAAIICTPPDTHYELANSLLLAGQHVLCEKPLARSLEEGIQMMEVARKCRRHLVMASKFRFVGDVIRTKSLLASGLLGNILYFENCFSGYVDMSRRWNSDPRVSGGGVLIDNGTHSVDIVRYLIGPIQSIRAHDVSTARKGPVEDTVHVNFQTMNGVCGTISLSWNIPFDRNAYIGMYGSEGRLRVNWNEACYQLNNKSEWIPFGYGYHKVNAFRRKIENFADTIQGKALPLISKGEALASIAAIEAAYRSLKSGKWEDVSEDYTK